METVAPGAGTEPAPPAGLPAEGAPTPSARQRILDAAFRLFYAHGVRAVGIDTVIAESGVAKATLYKHFPSKDDLAVAYLDRVDEIWKAQLERAATAAGPEPGRQLIGLFDALVTACRREGYHGCAFINAAAESPTGGAVHQRTVRHKSEVRAWIEGLARQAGAADPAGLARRLTLLLDGGLADGVLSGDLDAALSAKQAARQLLEAEGLYGDPVP
jgi:AcrR family transcriptional regulator